MVKGKSASDERLSRNEAVSIPDAIANLRSLLHRGFTHIEFRNSVLYHYSGRRDDARNHIKPSISPET